MRIIRNIQVTFNLLEITLGILLALVLISGFKYIEDNYMPVIKDFEVISVEAHQSGIAISGTMNKVRDCTLRYTIAYVHINDQSIPFPTNVIFDDANLIRSKGSQVWGPWTVIIPYEYSDAKISLHSTHKCNPIYNTASIMKTFIVNKDEFDNYSLTAKGSK